MAVRPEILAQIARMLGDDALRSASDGEVRAAAERHLDTLVDALVAEIADSDDVYDRGSAVEYAGHRLREFARLLPESLVARLQAAVAARIESW